MKRLHEADKPVRISPRTGKPVHNYVYHISDEELVAANRARRDAQLEILSDPVFKQARADRQTEIYYADPERQQRKSSSASKTQRDPARRKAQAKTTSESWDRQEDREKRQRGIRRANKRPEVIAKHKSWGKRRRKDMHDPVKGPEIMSRMLHSHRKSQPEKNLGFLLKLLKLPFKFVGNGKLIIGLFCPDFFCEEKKAIIELFSYHHTLPDNQARDKRRFALYDKKGYRYLVINGAELKDLRSASIKIKKWYKSLN